MSIVLKSILGLQKQTHLFNKTRLISNRSFQSSSISTLSSPSSQQRDHSNNYKTPILLKTCTRFASSFKMSKALIIGADGSESSELIIVLNVLRRAKVATKLVASDPAKDTVQCSDGTKIIADVSITDALKQDYDAIILPGGLGARDAYVASSLVKETIKKQEESGKLVGAICAAPTALISFGVGLKKKITSYPALGSAFDGKDYHYISDQAVVVDGNLVTSQGPFTSYAFALKLAEILTDKKTADDVKNAMLVKL